MDLNKINQALGELSVELPKKVRELSEAEYQYERRFADLVVHSGMGTALLKESEAKTALDAEGLWEPLIMLRGEVRALYHEKDCMLAIGANLRAMQVGQERNERETLSV